MTMKLKYFWDKLELIFILEYMRDIPALGYLCCEQIKDEKI